MIVRFVRSAAMVLVAGVLAYAALAAGRGAAQTAPSITVRFSFDGRIEAPAAPFLLALEEGYFRREGLDVRFEAAPEYPAPLKRIAAGSHEIGFADINALIRLHDRDPTAPVKAVFMVYDKAPYAVTARKSRGVTAPADLAGKTLAAPDTDPAYAVWPLLAKLGGVDASKVAVEKVGSAVREPMLAAGQVDAVLGASFTTYVNLKDRGVPVDDIVLLPFADYGVVLYGNAIVVNTHFAREHPDAVKGFLRAFLNGLKDAIRDPARATEAVIARNESANAKVELERLQMVLHDNILTPDAEAGGFGSVDPARFAAALDQIGLIAKFKSRPSLEELFDPAFLPSASARKLY